MLIEEANLRVGKAVLDDWDTNPTLASIDGCFEDKAPLWYYVLAEAQYEWVQRAKAGQGNAEPLKMGDGGRAHRRRDADRDAVSRRALLFAPGAELEAGFDQDDGRPDRLRPQLSASEQAGAGPRTTPAPGHHDKMRWRRGAGRGNRARRKPDGGGRGDPSPLASSHK